MNRPETIEEKISDGLELMTQQNSLIEETSHMLNTADECNQLLMDQMKRLTAPEDSQNLCQCAKEVREMLKLKFKCAKFLSKELKG